MIPSDRNGSYLSLRRINGFGVLILCILLVAFTLVQFPVSAASSYLFHPGFGSAVIDGYVETSEWATADSYTQLMSGGTLTGTLYVMQSATDLYLGFVIDDDEWTTGYWYGILGDTVEFEFDDNNSGSLFEIGENKVIVHPVDPWVWDAYYYTITGSSYEDTDQPSGQTNGEGGAARHGSDNHFELRFPLCSADTYDFCLSPGDILGLRIQYDDMFPAAPYDVTGTRFPGADLTSLVTIEIIDLFVTFIPIIQN